VSSCTIWLKTLNLALIEGTPQYIHLFLVILPLFLLSFDFDFFSFFRITFVFSFHKQNKGISVQVWGVL
jgi:hypothetical protein